MAIVVAVVLVGLIGRLAQVQVVTAPTYRDIASGNRLRVVETPSPRGRLLDAEGRVLAGNRSAYTVTLDWEGLADLDPPGRRSILLEAADELDDVDDTIDADHLEEVFQRARRQALGPVPVVDDVGPELWITLSERGLPGIEVAPRPRRIYPQGAVAAHVIGYLGTVVDEAEAARLNRIEPDHGYRPGSLIGRSGLERMLERHLRGVPEVRTVEVDAANRVVRTVEVTQIGRPGRDVHLTIDLDLQRLAEESLAAGLDDIKARTEAPAAAGSLVVVDPRDGSVPALVSLPGFDPTLFVAGLDSDEADRLFSDPVQPFLNRAIDGLYPAGSTFKPVTALAALAAGLRPAEAIWQDQGVYQLTSCRGSEQTGCRFRNAKGAVLGPVDLGAALTLSSDTYFYSLGERLWLHRSEVGDEALQDVARRFGLGVPSGIELPGEARGRVPTPQARREANRQAPEAFPDPRWYTGDNVNLAIGQGELLVTPVQLANLYATLATGGVRHQPRLVDRVVDPTSGRPIVEFRPRRAADEPIAPDTLTPILDGLLGVPVRGTAATAFAGFPLERFPVAAKTGTAEVQGRVDYALFAGFGPVPEPRYAFAAVIEEGGFGGEAAAPVVRRFLDGVLLIEDGGAPG